MSSATRYPLTDAPSTRAAVSIRRYVNDEIAAVAGRFDTGDEFEFVCECGDLACVRRVKMTLAQYKSTDPGSVVRH